ncbi:hypothetical protein SAMN05444365_103332 [Micromonospora pattaloongensis]|uniref:Uncharacterized protein n=1 Tax=Micromonospora pattaloongensis TaxID=405436 RepID=A0A1H3MEN3_9ACTN|nr:DUF6350 family protein [Micromonospora pattaloongensis]SDY74649.1 hypothetical protein SAMN05444365_103332 [Micromonospora pattaloongensis]
MPPTTPDLPPRSADPRSDSDLPLDLLGTGDQWVEPAAADQLGSVRDRAPAGDRPAAPRIEPRADAAGRDRSVDTASARGRAGGEPPRHPRSTGAAVTRRRGRAPLAVAAVVAACWAALVTYLPVTLVLWLTQIAGQTGGLTGAARIGLAGWLLGHGVPLDTSAGPLGLPPLALGALAAWRVARAGVHVTRAIGARESGSAGAAFTVAGAVGLGYGLLGAVVALVAGTATTTVAPLRAGLTLAVFGAVAAFVGAVRTTGALWSLAGRTAAPLRHGVRTGVVGALLVLGAGAGAAGLAVATGGGDASDMIGAYRTGVAGQAGITAISVGYAPNAAIWAASYLLGPGFAVGAGTVVRTTDVTLGPLPAVPLLAGLPNGPTGGVGAVLLAVPVVAGIGAGLLLGRRWRRAAQRDGTPVEWGGLLSSAVIAGPVAGGVLGLAAMASGGPLGGGRMAEIGPVPWQVAAAAAVLVTVGALVGAAASRVFAGS